MDRLTSLEFDAEFHYQESPAGILVPIRLTYGDRSVELRARVDTGAADCIFDDSYAQILGITDAGVRREYRTVAGSFKAHGHELTIETLGLEWTATVFFHAMANPAHSAPAANPFLQGRIGRRRCLHAGGRHLSIYPPRLGLEIYNVNARLETAGRFRVQLGDPRRIPSASSAFPS